MKTLTSYRMRGVTSVRRGAWYVVTTYGAMLWLASWLLKNWGGVEIVRQVQKPSRQRQPVVVAREGHLRGRNPYQGLDAEDGNRAKAMVQVRILPGHTGEGLHSVAGGRVPDCPRCGNPVPSGSEL